MSPQGFITFYGTKTEIKQSKDKNQINFGEQKLDLNLFIVTFADKDFFKNFLWTYPV